MCCGRLESKLNQGMNSLKISWAILDLLYVHFNHESLTFLSLSLEKMSEMEKIKIFCPQCQWTGLMTSNCKITKQPLKDHMIKEGMLWLIFESIVVKSGNSYIYICTCFLYIPRMLFWVAHRSLTTTKYWAAGSKTSLCKFG